MENDKLSTAASSEELYSLRQRLKEYRDADADIDNQIERYERLSSKVHSVGSQVLTDMPRSPSPSNDRMAEMLIKLEELETSIKETSEKQRQFRQHIEAHCGSLTSNEKLVIRSRYWDMENWDEVSLILFGGKKDYIYKTESYLRRTFKLHSKAIEKIAFDISKSEKDSR